MTFAGRHPRSRLSTQAVYAILQRRTAAAGVAALSPARTSAPSARSWTAAGCTRVFRDVASGKLARRPDWDACLDYLRAGDQLVMGVGEQIRPIRR